MTENAVLSFDRWLRRRRKALDLTQEELAQRAHCSLDTIRKFEAGERRPSRSMAESLSAALDLDDATRVLFLRAARMPPGPEQDTLIASLPAIPTARPQIPAPTHSIAVILYGTLPTYVDLWGAYPRLMGHVTARFSQVLQSAIDGAGGQGLVDARDSFHATFPTVIDALRAAVDIQRAALAPTWIKHTALPVCVAVHIGTIDSIGDPLRGLLLSRLTELCAAGHPGQVLLTAAAYQLSYEALPEQFQLRDMGRHVLAGSGRAEHVFQLLAAGLPNQTLPLRRKQLQIGHVIPAALPLIGREHERISMSADLQRDEVRLLTLTGPGGIGKTRLCHQLLVDLEPHFPDGTAFVSLAALADPASVGPTIAAAFHVTLSESGPPLDDLIGYLRGRRILLALDNFEHLLEAAPLLSQILARAPSLKLLVTSRSRLQLYQERVVPVPPLPVLAPLLRAGQLSVAQALTSPAVQLFVQRAEMVDTRFVLSPENVDAVAEICARLDGLPLAIELAAARVALLPPALMLRRLNSSFEVLATHSPDRPTRQQTLRNTLDWSYNLLTPDEQRLFRQSAIFGGGCELADLAAVALGPQGSVDELSTLETADALLCKSLLQCSTSDSQPRLSMLETVRLYALEQLEQSGEITAVRACFLRHYLAMAEQIEPDLRGARQEIALARLSRESANLRVALAIAQDLDRTSSESIGLRLCAALWRFWWIRGHYDEGRRWLAQALASPTPGSPRVRAMALRGAGVLARAQGDLVAAISALTESLVTWRDLGELSGIAQAINSLGVVYFNQQRYEQARSLFEESLALYRQAEDWQLVAVALNNLGNIAGKQGRYAQAMACYQEGLALVESHTMSKETIALLKLNIGETARMQQDYPQAERMLHESAQIYLELADAEGIRFCLANLIEIAIGCQRGDRAAWLMGTLDALYEQLSARRSPEQEADYQRHVAEIRAMLGETEFVSACLAGRAAPIAEIIAEPIAPPIGAVYRTVG